MKKLFVIFLLFLSCASVQKIGTVIYTECDQDIWGEYSCVGIIRTIEDAPTVIKIDSYVGQHGDTVIIEKNLKWKLINSYEQK